MSERPRESRARTLARFAGITIAFGLTIVAAWMIALGHSQRQNSLGVIIGLWAALIGAMTFFGGRHAAGTSGGFGATAGGTGADLELRQDFALELQREVSARRAYEQQLHEMVRREIETIQRVVGDQLGKLRDDVATLRGDLVDQVGGKIRLERIETTRVIGSDIEALQNEVRQLAGGGRLTDPVNRPADVQPRIVDQRPVEAQSGVPSAVLPPLDQRRPDERAAPAAEVGPPPRPEPVPAYQPYIAPTYAPAVTYTAGSAGGPVPQYSAPEVSNPSPINGTPVSKPSPAPTPYGETSLNQPLAAASLPSQLPPIELPPIPSVNPSATLPYASSAPLLPAPPVAPAPPIAPTPPAAGMVPPVPAAPALPPFQAPSSPLPPLGANGANGSNGYGASIGSSDDADPFAGLPRLSRFEDDDPLPAAPAPPQPAPPAWQPPPLSATPSPQPWEPPADQWSPAPAPAPASNGNGSGRRHAAAEDEEQPAPQVGRRRRAEGDTDDVLSRLLGRS